MSTNRFYVLEYMVPKINDEFYPNLTLLFTFDRYLLQIVEQRDFFLT